MKDDSIVLVFAGFLFIYILIQKNKQLATCNANRCICNLKACSKSIIDLDYIYKNGSYELEYKISSEEGKFCFAFAQESNPSPTDGETGTEGFSAYNYESNSIIPLNESCGSIMLSAPQNYTARTIQVFAIFKIADGFCLAAADAESTMA